MNSLKRWMHHGKSYAFTMIVALLALSSCEEDDLAPEGDYFPLQEGLQWNYHVRYHFSYEDTITLFTHGDTLIENKRYKKIENVYGMIKMVRREGPRYYEWSYSGDRLFLDISKPVAGSWMQHASREGSFFKGTQYLVKGRDGWKRVNGIMYRDVITIEETNIYEDFKTTTYHCYAKGIGEIYLYYSYHIEMPYSPGMEQTIVDLP